MTEATRLADRRRIQAMRLVSDIINFPVTDEWTNLNRAIQTKYLFVPKPQEWGFIDMDPIIAPDDWYGMSDDKFDAQWPVDLAIAFPWFEDGASWNSFRSTADQCSPANFEG